MEKTARNRPLTTAQEQELGRRIRQGDNTALGQLVEANMGFAWSLAQKFQTRPSLDLEDLVQDALVGLIQAARRYDPARGRRFCTFAAYWIRRELHLSCRKSALIWTPVWLDRRPDRLYFHPGARIRARAAAARRRFRRITTIALVSRTLGPEAQAMAADEDAWLARALRRLTPLQRQVILLRHRSGLFQKEVAKRLGITRQRVSQIELEALARLRSGRKKLTQRSG